MQAKARAIPWPELAGKTLLDVGCDHGWWCWRALDMHAAKVVGLDRGRMVEGGFVELAARNRQWAEDHYEGQDCAFHATDIGRQWHEFGRFDVVLCLSMYHHVYHNCGDHAPIWFWLWRHCDGELLWENPIGTDDPVVRMNVAAALHAGYTRAAILEAAEPYFEIEHIGPAQHVPTREVWRCTPRALEPKVYRAKIESGAGGAAPAFQFAGGRRIGEVEEAIGVRPIPGSLNLRAWDDFDWNGRYYRAGILDPVDRKDIRSEWRPRWARFYPLAVNGIPAHAFRFEGDRYDPRFVELIADRLLIEELRDRPVVITA